jgi:hypothetical protein
MAEMTNLSPRYELKQAYSDLLLPELQSWVRMHPAGFRTTYPSRQVNSFYFDTPDLDTFNDHLEGVPVRRKLRYRWYGPDLSTGQNGHIEVKNKSELAGWKLIEKLSDSYDFEHSSWGAVMDQMRSSATGLFRELLAVSRPVLLIVYNRSYYESADGLIRLTIDSNLQAFDQYLKSAPNIKFHQVNDGQIVLELKSEVNQLSILSDVLSHFPIRANRYSKFVNNLWQIMV